MVLRILLIAIVVLGIGLAVWRIVLAPSGPSAAGVRAAYETPLTAPQSGLAVFHLGHSLVGRDMPAMLAQLAPAGHQYNSQLGWGTSLREHWEPNLPINGFKTENDHAQFRDAAAALSSAEYDAVVLTEMVELRDALKYHDSATYLTLWARKARDDNPQTRVYLYETWHRLDDPNGWLNRLDGDLAKLWEQDLLYRVPDVVEHPIYLVPAGQVLARFVRAVEAQGGLDSIKDRTDLFARDDTGAVDQIHLNDLGHYLVALTHYAVLYHRSPVGLPHMLRRADGHPAVAPSPREAEVMQKTVWDVVTALPKTGVAQ